MGISGLLFKLYFSLFSFYILPLNKFYQSKEKTTKVGSYWHLFSHRGYLHAYLCQLTLGWSWAVTSIGGLVHRWNWKLAKIEIYREVRENIALLIYRYGLVDLDRYLLFFRSGFHIHHCLSRPGWFGL